MFWIIRTLEVLALMFGTDVLWLGWTSYQRWKLKQAKSILTAVRQKKKRLPTFREARIPRQSARGARK